MNIKRGHRFNLMLSKDENEFLARKAFEHGLSVNSWARQKLLHNGWRKDLESLKQGQDCDLSEIDSRRKA